ncbi:trithorax group protein osa isoform X2 [Aethina tumida]|uniref:trithorax group protein osa isoform X2 n=1 Tax=Aethina tumida TaxID=116153 RepID=UPI002149737C|nr:trithorax group protein osa isoform X2 [Aethina tumida]
MSANAQQQQTGGGGGQQPCSQQSCNGNKKTQQQVAQTNGGGSSGSTPASTPAGVQSSPPPNNAPKYGTLVPNRIFVGGISANTTESELLHLFSSYGPVKAAKIIQDRAGVSKGYGFITFESEDDAKRPLREADNIVLRERKLNIAPAIKKQPFSRAFDASSPPAVAPGNPAQYFFSPGAATVPYFQGGVAYYHQPAAAAPGDPGAQQPTVYQHFSYAAPPVYPTQTGPPQAATYPPSMMFPQAIYMPQQYPMPIPYDYSYYQANGGASPHQYIQQGQQPQPQQQGPQCGAPPAAMTSSNSPPRCYAGGPAVSAQQLHAGMYGPSPADPLYYGMAMYGAAAVEGAPIYTEAAYEMAGPGGPIYGPEDVYPDYGLRPPSNGGELAGPDGAQPPTNDLGHSMAPLALPPPPPPPPQPHQPPPPSQLHSSTATDVNIAHLPIHDRTSTPQPPVTDDATSVVSKDNPEALAAEVRNTATPVVSLLNIEQHQEKDFAALQGGRKPRPAPQQPPPLPHNPYHPGNGMVYSYHSFPTNGYMYNSGYHDATAMPAPSLTHRYAPKNMSNGLRKRRTDYNGRRPNNDHSSHSSLRTDSNSSASAADETTNRGDEQRFRTGVNTPPPTAYSPITNQTYGKPYNQTQRTYYHNNNNNGSRSNGLNWNNNNSNRPNNNHQGTPAKYHTHGASVTYTRTTSNQSFRQNDRTKANVSNPPVNEMVATTTSYMPLPRRPRRSIRRGQGEMGQGDGPTRVPDEGGAQVAKKMENLKL